MHDLANSVRRLYNRLRSTTDRLHAEDGLSAQRRTLLLELQRNGEQTVPTLAAVRSISRQIIQTQVNDLLGFGYVELLENPEHKRSSLVALTVKGSALVEQMITREESFIDQMDWLPEREELAVCIRVLDQIESHLEKS